MCDHLLGAWPAYGTYPQRRPGAAKRPVTLHRSKCRRARSSVPSNLTRTPLAASQQPPDTHTLTPTLENQPHQPARMPPPTPILIPMYRYRTRVPPHLNASLASSQYLKSMATSSYMFWLTMRSNAPRLWLNTGLCSVGTFSVLLGACAAPAPPPAAPCRFPPRALAASSSRWRSRSRRYSS